MANAVVDFVTKLLMKHSPNRRYSLATVTGAGLITGTMACLLHLDRGAYPDASFDLTERVKELEQFHFASTRIIRPLQSCISTPGLIGRSIEDWLFSNCWAYGSASVR
jgi:hypothetical protein